VGITRTRVQTHKNGVLPYPLWVFFASTHWTWVQLPSLVKDGFTRFIFDCYQNGKLTKVNYLTFIALIRKLDSHHRLNDFRPISLVGCLYKVLAKVLANRIRQVIGSVVSNSQFALVIGRQILNHILIANEVLEEAHKFKKEMLLFEMDFEKTYDSVD